MKLLQKNLADTWFLENHYTLPRYDRGAVLARTKQQPRWLHIGGGNIARAFIAQIVQDALDAGQMDTGLIVSAGAESILRAYRPFDDLCVNVVLHADGSVRKNILGNITESLILEPAREDWTRLHEIFCAPSLQLVSFTITEKGYNLKDLRGDYQPDVLDDFASGPAAPKTCLGKIAALCHARYRAGAMPLALVSMDNCSRNGERLAEAVGEFARHWAAHSLVEDGFVRYMTDGTRLTYPWTAIDKITPRPDPAVCRMLQTDGLEDMQPIETARHTFIAPFVNAEQTQYLVIEDHFPNGRPALQAEGVYFTNRETVEKFEQMKVCTCLNPLHTALALLGCLLGFTRISDEMKDADLVALICRLAFEESMPVVVNPGILDPLDFAKQVIDERLPNPFIPDTPQRIATDTSQKLSIRFGNTIRAYQRRAELDVKSLRCIPFVLAVWCRYLLLIDDNGQPFTPSADPMLDTLHTQLAAVTLGSPCDAHALLQPILSNPSIFGVDLYQAGLGEAVETFFTRLTLAPGAVRATLHDLLRS